MGGEEYIPSSPVPVGSSHWLIHRKPEEGFLGDGVHRGQPSGAQERKRKIKNRSWGGGVRAQGEKPARKVRQCVQDLQVRKVWSHRHKDIMISMLFSSFENTKKRVVGGVGRAWRIGRSGTAKGKVIPEHLRQRLGMCKSTACWEA